MTRVLMIDGDRALAQSVAVTCVESGLAVRLAETLCEGVRHMLDTPVSVVLVDSGLMRLEGSDQARLFETVAPGVPVVVLLRPGAPVDERVKLELRGFQVVPKPFDVRDVLAKVELAAKSATTPAGAERWVDAVRG
jgi:DNA-binding response OmpR family regulator